MPGLMYESRMRLEAIAFAQVNGGDLLSEEPNTRSVSSSSDLSRFRRSRPTWIVTTLA